MVLAVIGFTEHPTDNATAGELATALVGVPAEVVVSDYDGRRLAAVELRETDGGREVRLRFARRRRPSYGPPPSSYQRRER